MLLTKNSYAPLFCFFPLTLLYYTSGENDPGPMKIGRNAKIRDLDYCSDLNFRNDSLPDARSNVSLTVKFQVLCTGKPSVGAVPSG